MKGIENVTGKIIADAEAYAANLKAQSDAEVSQIISEAEKEIDDFKTKENAKCEKEQADIKRRYESTASLEARKAYLAARREMISESFDTSLKLLEESRGNVENYVKMLALIAAPYLEDSSIIMLDSADFAACEKPLAALLAGGEIKAKFAKMLDKIKIVEGKLGGGGLVVKNADVEMNLTFAALLHSYREELESDVAKALFD